MREWKGVKLVKSDKSSLSEWLFLRFLLYFKIDKYTKMTYAKTI